VTERWKVKVEQQEGRVVALKPGNLRCTSGNAVSNLHSKFYQDPSLFQDASKSFRATLGSDDEFAAGITGKLGQVGCCPMRACARTGTDSTRAKNTRTLSDTHTHTHTHTRAHAHTHATPARADGLGVREAHVHGAQPGARRTATVYVWGQGKKVNGTARVAVCGGIARSKCHHVGL